MNDRDDEETLHEMRLKELRGECTAYRELEREMSVKVDLKIAQAKRFALTQGDTP